MHGKSASEYNFSGVGCNFRVFQGQRKSRVFQGLPGFAGHPDVNYTYVRLLTDITLSYIILNLCFVVLLCMSRFTV